MFARTVRCQAAVTPQMVLMCEQRTSMQALRIGTAGSQTLNACVRAAAHQVC